MSWVVLGSYGPSTTQVRPSAGPDLGQTGGSGFGPQGSGLDVPPHWRPRWMCQGEYREGNKKGEGNKEKIKIFKFSGLGISLRFAGRGVQGFGLDSRMAPKDSPRSMEYK